VIQAIFAWHEGHAPNQEKPSQAIAIGRVESVVQSITGFEEETHSRFSSGLYSFFSSFGRGLKLPRNFGNPVR